MAVGATLYDRYIRKYAEKYNLSPSLLGGVIQTESGGNPVAVSDSGAIGLGQLLPKTAAALGVKNPLDPEQNIEGAAKLLRENLDHTGQNVNTALKMYHGGTNMRNWGALTNAYPDKVLSNAEAYAGATGQATSPFDPQATVNALMGDSISKIAAQKEIDDKEAEENGVFGKATNLLQRGWISLIAILLIGLGLYFILAKRLPLPGGKIVKAIGV